MFSFVRNCQAVFQSGCNILHYHQQCMKAPIASHPHQHLVLSVFWILAILLGVFHHYFNLHFHDDWNVEHFFHMIICHQYISSLMRCLLSSLAHFLIRLFVFLLLSFKSSLDILGYQSFIRCVFCKYFFPVCGLSSHSPDIVSHRTETFIFNEVQIINYFFHGLCLWCCT